MSLANTRQNKAKRGEPGFVYEPCQDLPVTSQGRTENVAVGPLSQSIIDSTYVALIRNTSNLVTAYPKVIIHEFYSTLGMSTLAKLNLRK